MTAYRISHWLRTPIPPTHPERRVRLNLRAHGTKIRVEIRLNCGDYCGDSYALVEILLGNEYADFLPRGLTIKTVLDLGANVGMFSLLCALVFPGVDIYCVEPEPGNVDQLRRNLASINMKSTRALEGAAWIYDGETTLITNADTAEHSLLDASQKTGSITIRCYTMETIFRLAGFSEIDLLKVDIEGAERELLEQCDDWIGRVKLILLELHSSMTGFDLKKLKAKLQPLGFVVFEKRFPFCVNSQKVTAEEMSYLTELMERIR